MPHPTAEAYINQLRAMIHRLLEYVLIPDGSGWGPNCYDDDATAALHKEAEALAAEDYILPRPDPNGATLRALVRRMAAADSERVLAQLLQMAQDIADREGQP